MENGKTENQILALTPVEYWEWRTTLADLETEKTKLELHEARLQIMQKNSEMIALRAQLFSATKFRDAKESCEASRQEYFRFKKALEDRMGTSLDNKVIDEITFEVKELPKTETKTLEGNV